ncbi:MAG: relaxase domain-containing protein [Deltaproteobacteria bacterium]|jgi:conjugative relaxase-like TrwC/TraI family protein|nr:relaxase domain-containing protein [Deltaproteobacteria bacterium]
MLSIDIKMTPVKAEQYFQKEKEQFEIEEYYTSQNSETFYGGLANKFVGDKILEPSKASQSKKPEKHVSLKSGRAFRDFLGGKDAIDMTFSASKGLSVLIELTGDEELRKKLIEIHENAACGAMRYVEKNLAYTRLSHRENGKKVYDNVYPGKMEYAAFLHHDTREKDPEVHSHFIVPRRLFVRGQEYALEIGPTPVNKYKNILSNKKALGELYRARAINQLRQNDIAVKITDYKQFFYDIEGIEQTTLKTFSKRSEEIKEEFEKVKNDTAAGSEAEVKNQIALRTRHPKDSSVPLQELREGWKEESPQKNIAPIMKSVRLAGDEDIQNAFNIAAKKRTENKSGFSDLDLRVEIMKTLIYQNLRFNEEDIGLKIKEMIKRKELVALDADNFFFTTKKIRNAEKRIEFFAKNTFEKYESITDKESVKSEIDLWEKNEAEIFKKERDKDFKLTGDQKKVLEAILTSKNGVVVVQGDAGTGKTTLLKALSEITAEKGVELEGLSTTGQAVKEIIEQGKIRRAKTIDSHILSGGNIQSFTDSNGKKVYIVDESSMNATVKIKEVIDIAEKENARIILIGDIKQLASIMAGGMFERLMKLTNVTVVEMHESIRQIDPFLKEAVKTIAEGKVKEGLKMLDEKNKIHVYENKFELYDKITNAFVKEDNMDNFILSARNEDRFALNKIVREKLQEAGKVDREDFAIKIREGKSIGDEDKKQIWNYAVGDVIVRGNGKHSFKVQEVDFENKILKTVNMHSGKEAIFSGNKLNSNQVYIETEKKFAKGDKIVFLKNDYHIGVQNGLVGFIKNIDGNKIEIALGKLGSEKMVTINTEQYNYFTHAYAITSYKSQGQTAEKVYIYSDRTTKNEFYVNVSRAKKEIEIFTMDKKLLFKTALKDDRQIDSITTENRNYKNYSIIENILNNLQGIDTTIPNLKEITEKFKRENERKEYQKPEKKKEKKIIDYKKTEKQKPKDDKEEKINYKNNEKQKNKIERKFR